MRRLPIVFLDNGLLSELQSGDSLDIMQVFDDDFVGNLPAIYGNGVSGAGSAVTTNTGAIGGTNGNLTVRAGIAGTATARLYTGQNQLLLGGGYYFGMGARFYLPSISSATVRYTIRLGIGGAVTTSTGDQTGIYFRYNDSVAGGVIQGVTRNGVTETVVNSTIVPANDVLYDVYFLVDSLGTSVSFYINGNLIGTSSTNLPTTATLLGMFASIQKAVGTTSRDLQVDKWYTENLK